MRRAQSVTAINNKKVKFTTTRILDGVVAWLHPSLSSQNFESLHSAAKTTPHPQPRKDSKFSRAPSKDDNFSNRRKSKNKSNSSGRQKTFRPQKSLAQSPTKEPKFSRGGQSIRKSLLSNEKPKFAPKAGLSQCSICSRNFAPERISKHKEICAKSSRTRRKVFDVSASRVEGTDAAQFQGVKVRISDKNLSASSLEEKTSLIPNIVSSYNLRKKESNC